MNIIHTMKNLPVIGLITIGLALSSNTAMADKADRDGRKGQMAQQFSHELDKSYGKRHKHSKPHKERRHGKNYRKHSHKHHSRDHGHRHKGHKSHGHRDYHRHGYRGHSHSYSSLHHVGHGHNYVDFDDLHFMIGLHTDRFDIILRD